MTKPKKKIKEMTPEEVTQNTLFYIMHLHNHLRTIANILWFFAILVTIGIIVALADYYRLI